MQNTLGEERQLSCVDLDDAGLGVGELHEGNEVIVVHVAGGLPGETLAVCLVHRSQHVVEGRRHAWAALRSILTPSPDRLSPACNQQGICGGCALMPLAYPAQLAWKQRRVRRSFAVYKNLADIEVEPCHPSARDIGYRNHAKYVYGRPSGGKEPVLGAYAPRSHSIVDQTGCCVVEPILEQTRQALLPCLLDAEVLPYDESTHTGLLRYVILRATSAEKVLVTWVIGQTDWPGADVLARILVNRCPWVVGVILNINRQQGNVLLGEEERCLVGESQVEDVIGKIPMRLAARSFFQANRRTASQLYKGVLDAAESQAPFARIVDVYAGAGGIALSLARLGNDIIAIEENPATTQAAEVFLTQHGLPLRFLTGDAAARLGEIDQADLVVLNPPRKGCDEAVLTRVLALRPRQVIYISCDPQTLARDLSRLVSGGLVVSVIRPYDMMPQTPHVETLAVLCAGTIASKQKETISSQVASKS